MAFFAYTPHKMPFHTTISHKILRSFADRTDIKKPAFLLVFQLRKQRRLINDRPSLVLYFALALQVPLADH